MVGSNLNCTATAHLLSLAGLGDVDGPLLVDDGGLFDGGLEWTTDAADDKGGEPHGSVTVPDAGERSYGLGIVVNYT